MAVLDAIKRVLGLSPKTSMPASRERYYHVCPECRRASVNALWSVERRSSAPFDLWAHCPRCSEWVAFEDYVANTLDKSRSAVEEGDE